MKKILLVAPLPLKFELTQDASYFNLPFSKARSFLMPLHIATIAGITPDNFHVDLWDESVMGRIEDSSDYKGYDIIGVTGYTAHLPRAKEIADLCRHNGILVAIGGSGISSMPQRYYNDFDVIFIGEADLTWPRFLAEWSDGNYQKIYRQVRSLDLNISRPPRWKNIADHVERYLVGAVQTSRGCPFDCEFCDVSYIFGRKFRHKSIDRVLEEIVELERIGVRRIVFCDDNFYGNPRYTKELLQKLIKLNNSLKYPLGFASEASINVATDDELLQLLADANFIEIFIGIESPNKESLKSSNKLQNFRSNLVEDLIKIQSYGMSVRGSLIVGFDHDDKDIFEEQFQFVQEASLTVPSIRVLMAPPGTRLWKRLQSEGRLVKTESEGRFFGNPGTTNIIPMLMTRSELHGGYLDLIEKVYDWKNFAVRMKGFISNVKRKPNIRRQRIEWRRLVQFAYFLFFLVDRETRRNILDVLKYTRKKAPFMMTKFIAIMLRQNGYAQRPAMRKSIENQIERENVEGFQLPMESDSSLISKGFLNVYGEIFPGIYENVSLNLTDRSRLEETLIEIFAEFLSQWKESDDTVAEDLRVQLMEISGRIINMKNTSAEIQITSSDNGGEGANGINVSHLSDQILKAVEQELLVNTKA